MPKYTVKDLGKHIISPESLSSGYLINFCFNNASIAVFKIYSKTFNIALRCAPILPKLCIHEQSLRHKSPIGATSITPLKYLLKYS
jgi:hypothetical protein